MTSDYERLSLEEEIAEFGDSYLYDDEYDDTYDSNDVGANDADETPELLGRFVASILNRSKFVSSWLNSFQEWRRNWPIESV